MLYFCPFFTSTATHMHNLCACSRTNHCTGFTFAKIRLVGTLGTVFHANKIKTFDLKAWSHVVALRKHISS